MSRVDWTREITLANIPGEYGHTPNCQRCVVAHEARMRGYDVVARPSWGANDPLHSTWLHAFNFSYSDFAVCQGQTGEEVIKSTEKLMRGYGEGSRAIIVFKWDKTKTFAQDGHVIVAQCRERDVINFGDPQTGERAAAYKLNFADFAAKVVLLRTDNLKFTDIIKRCCKNRSE